ncbi:MAG: S9 family peptidase, partial [Planctomycetota bacterium]
MATRTAARKRPSRARSRRRAITPEDLLCMVGVGEAQMSPDGRAVLFMRKVVNARNAYETSVWAADPDGRRAPRALTAGPKDVMPRWSPDGTRV